MRIVSSNASVVVLIFSLSLLVNHNIAGYFRRVSRSKKLYNSANTFANYAQMKDLTQINARAMQIFLAVLSEGSLSEVARREGISPSSVSRVQRKNPRK
ncbi:hypothetical protein XSR1_170002 [Xenorhabdus szentirmaii DSM 16338]|uniref:HTH lysR-type domain-containing protein n=1 Tax=Xenorhabdus szentirmaii DSM 16338 TaxID=1427518 RepID=W1ITQ9_9GAMM|nr:hypothetical protein XSR1_170002 [Xenorhabdus szentirmaii DSM 16338]